MKVQTITKPARQALIVLGMHRSGTSALGGVLARLGVQPPKSLMHGDRHNEKGYWESSVITDFHDKLLHSAGTHWSDWDGFNEGWLNSPVAEGFLAELSELVVAEFGDEPLFFIKDPRICRFLPVWLAVLERLAIEPKIIIPVRNPEEVARSLATRDKITWSRATLLWLRHILDAESRSRNLRRVFLHYHELLDNWRGQLDVVANRLDISWPRLSAAVECEVESYLTSDMHRHIVSAAVPSRPSVIGEWSWLAYQAIDALVRKGEDPSASLQLDNIKLEFDRTSSIYAPVLHEARNALQGSAEEAERKLHGAMAQLREADARYELLRQENLANYNLAMAHKITLDDLRDQFQNRENANAAMKAKCELLELESVRQEQAHEAKLTELSIRRNDEIRDLRLAKRLAEETAHERFNELAAISRRLLELEDLNKAKASALRGAEAKLRAVEKTLASAVSQKRKLQHQLSVGREQLRALQLEMQTQEQLIGVYRSSLAAVHSSRAWKAMKALRNLLGGTTVSTDFILVQNDQSDEQLLRSTKLFDSAWYLKRYRDVMENGADPVDHYLQHGASEGRDPGPAFSTAGYLTRYPDVSSAGVNPLVHYLRHGRAEGRWLLEGEGVAGNGFAEARN